MSERSGRAISAGRSSGPGRPVTSAARRGRALTGLDLRPLDPVRSIKAKLGLLVLGSTVTAVMTIWLFVAVLGWRGRYGALVAVAAALVVTQLLAHGMTSPLREMTAAARAMADGGPVPPLRTSSRDEVGELARAFTTMAADLAAADRRRRELLANVTHELRTPVTALRAQLENLVDGVRTVDSAALAEVLAQVEGLGGLLEDLLDLARADAGVVRPDVRPLALLPLADESARQVRTARPGARIRLEVPEALTVPADPHRLRQVLVNLLDNAARHAGPDGQVQVRARADGHEVLVQVCDDGPGIPPEQRERVFERFDRGADARTAPDGGTGLGLAIARWAVALHGGRIAVAPTDHGCTVEVRLPLAPQEGR